MKTIFKISLKILFSFGLIYSNWSCQTNTNSERNSSNTDSTRKVGEVLIKPNIAEGGKYKPYKPNTDFEPNENPVFNIPDGPIRGQNKPTKKATTFKKIKGRGNAAADQIVIGTYTPVNSGIPNMSSVPDMSVARNGNTVFLTGNWFSALSKDGGATFKYIDPTTIMPVFDAAGNKLDGGWCCDQVVHYIPKYDMFVLLHQFCGDGTECKFGKNRIRIAVCSTKEMIDSDATKWTYYDFTSSIMGNQPGIFDYPDISIGNNNLYWSADVVGTGLMTVRISLAELNARSTLNVNYTNPSDGGFAYGSHLTQNTGDAIFWAGHVNNSTLRVFNMNEGTSTYSWRDIPINSWNKGQPKSISPDGTTDWLSFNFPANSVIGSSRAGNNVWFAWTAKEGGNYKQPHVQMVRIDISTFSFKEQVQVWNNDYAFGYPYLSFNSRNELGMSMGVGGGTTFYGTHVMGVWGDFVLWYPELSDAGLPRWGDYTTVRKSNLSEQLGANFLWDAAGYFVRKQGANKQITPYYAQFGRQSVYSSIP
jgi:hypothetical protein